MIVTYGLDASLRHGIMVRAVWDFSSGVPVLRSYDIMSKWTNDHVSKMSQLAILVLAQKIARSVRDIDEYPRVGIDFDFDSVFFRGKAGPVMRVSFLMGAIGVELSNRDARPIYLKPREVREAFGLKANVAKEAVHEHLIRILPSRTQSNKKAEGDLQDALVLSLIVAQATE